MQFKGFPRLILPDGRVVSIERSPFIVGQYDSFCQLTIDDDDIAPVHFQLEYDNDRWFVRDLKSKTGVMINEDIVPFGACAPVDHSDCVTMGHYKITFAVRPDALITVDECDQINTEFENLLSRENFSKRENALSLIEFLRKKIDTVARIAGIDAITATDSDDPSHFDLDENNVNQSTYDGVVTASQSIETLSSFSDNSGDVQSDFDYASQDSMNSASSFEAQSSSDKVDNEHSSSFSENAPAFPDADSVNLSSRIMTPPPDVSQRGDAQVASPSFSLRDRSASAGSGVKSEVEAFHQISNETSFEKFTDVKAGFRLMPDDPTIDIMVVDHFPFSVGKRSQCDYVLKKSDVSRLHAMITDKAGDVYLTDKDSTNGTFVGGNRLSPEEPMKLSDGDFITFAGYGFTVSF